VECDRFLDDRSTVLVKSAMVKSGLCVLPRHTIRHVCRDEELRLPTFSAARSYLGDTMSMSVAFGSPLGVHYAVSRRRRVKTHRPMILDPNRGPLSA